MRLVVERYDHLPWDHGFGSDSLVRELAARVPELEVLCECHEGDRDTLDLPENVRFLSLRGEQPRHSRRPRAFQAWIAAQTPAREGNAPLVSLTPLVAGDVWFPARFPSLASIREEYQRSSPYITFLKTKKWIGPRIEAAARVLRRERGSRLREVVALDERGVEHAHERLRVPAGAVRVVGRASGRAESEDASALRRDTRAALGVSDDTRLALLAASRPGSPGVRRVVEGLAQARREGVEVELLAMGFRQHGFLREALRHGVGPALHPVGATSRMDALYAACDLVLLPSMPTGPLDESIVVDAIACHRPVIAGRGAAAAHLATEGRGLAIDDASPAAWCAALGEVCGWGTTDDAASVAMSGLVGALLAGAGAGTGQTP
ncbi:MAG: glycosyltransferase [Phycisphaerales bacterium]|nr:glycosyltransferase [Phycisphaerales bacterium]